MLLASIQKTSRRAFVPASLALPGSDDTQNRLCHLALPPSKRKLPLFNQVLAGQSKDGPGVILNGQDTRFMQPVRRTSFAKLTQQDVSAAIVRHEMLCSGRMGGARAVFAFCDLGGLDLSGHNLSDADFTGAHLEEANLAGARMDSANFFGADMRRANLTAASLKRADLRGASLRGADLSGADLYEADMREGTIAERDRCGDLRILQHDLGPLEMPGALLNLANLERAKISGVIAIQADFTDAIMKGCRLVRANLRQATLPGANLENADFSNCDLSGANLNGAILVGAQMTNTLTQGADMTDAMTDARSGRSIADLPVPVEELLASHARWVETDGREGQPADLSRLDLRKFGSFAHRMLTALIAPGANFYGQCLEGASLQGSNLQGADLRYAKLAGADLRGVNLIGAKLGNADLHGCQIGLLMISDSHLLPARLDKAAARYADFRGADLRRVNFTGADLAYANLCDTDLRGANIDAADTTGAKLSRETTQTIAASA